MVKNKHSRLKKSFYTQTDVVGIAQELLGKILVTHINGELTSGMIVETEAYRGSDDKACHAYPYKKTDRTKIMFAEGGVSYVYLCYGIHHLFNIITSVEGEAEAVLIRGIEPIDGIDSMLERRNLKEFTPRLTAGPGSLSQALGINRKWHNAISLVEENSVIWLEDRNISIPKENIIASRRVGIDFAEECALWNWRFRIKNNKWTSKGKGLGE